MLVVITIMSMALLAGCSKTIRMEEVIQAASLEVEPTDWVSESAIATLESVNLPGELQRTYMNLINDGYEEVIMKNSDGGFMYITSDQNGIYAGSDIKFFQSASGNVVEVKKDYRTLYRTEYFGNEKQNAFNSIRLDTKEDPGVNSLNRVRSISTHYEGVDRYEDVFDETGHKLKATVEKGYFKATLTADLDAKFGVTKTYKNYQNAQAYMIQYGFMLACGLVKGFAVWLLLGIVSKSIARLIADISLSRKEKKEAIEIKPDEEMASEKEQTAEAKETEKTAEEKEKEAEIKEFPKEVVSQ